MSFRDPPFYYPVIDQAYIVTHDWFEFFRDVADRLAPGVSVTVPLAKITPAGTNGQLTIVNGLITAVVQPT